jgi:hypothetical protein
MFPVESFQLTLVKLARILQQHGIRYHLTGGMTSVAYGEPRMTQDIDIVVDPARSKVIVDDFLASLSTSDFMFHEAAVRQAIDRGGLYQLLDRVECLKLDIYPRELIPGELSRTEQLELFSGVTFPVVSRVDAAASKLVWIGKGSHKSRRDLRAIFRGSSEAQQELIRKQADALGLADLLVEVLAEPDEWDEGGRMKAEG